jgi:hypothetical protein
MTPMSSVQNPFLMLVQPEVVLAAVQKSEKLGRLNRHLCRPLDRPLIPTVANADAAGSGPSDIDEDDEL